MEHHRLTSCEVETGSPVSTTTVRSRTLPFPSMSLRIADMPVSPVQAVHVMAAASISRRDVDARRKTRRAVDATCAFVAGLYVGRRSVGHVERQLEPWRGTGIEVRGPALAGVEQA